MIHLKLNPHRLNEFRGTERESNAHDSDGLGRFSIQRSAQDRPSHTSTYVYEGSAEGLERLFLAFESSTER